MTRRVANFAWPLVLLLLFLGTFRRTERGAAAQVVGFDCERPDAISLETCLAHDPTNVALLTDLAAGYEASGRIDMAEAAYRRALTIDAKDGDLHVRLGELLLTRGDRSGAHAEAESALRWHPASARALGLAARSADSNLRPSANLRPLAVGGRGRRLGEGRRLQVSDQ